MKLGLGLIGLLVIASIGLAAGPTPATKVTVDHFTCLTPSGDVGWIGSALQQAVLTDLSRRGGMVPAAGTLDAAKKDGAEYSIGGNFQLVNGNLRVLGQIYRTKDAKPVAGLYVTGSLHDIFTIEDDLSAQARRELAALNVGGPTTRPQRSPARTAMASRQDNGPLRAAPYVPQIAPMPHAPPGDPWILLNGPPDYCGWGYGYGGWGCGFWGGFTPWGVGSGGGFSEW